MIMRNETRNIVLTAVFMALGVLLPQIFHLVGLGIPYSPMHLPVLIGGFILGWKYGLIIGVVTPLLSSAFTGMPAIFPMGILMAAELGTYGALSGFLYDIKKRVDKYEILHIYLALIMAMIGGRIVYWAGMALYQGVQGQFYSLTIFYNSVILFTLPGIIVQLALVPPLIYLLKRTIIFNKVI